MNRSGIYDENIRFYEAKGLIHPERDRQGFRQYTENDLDALLRIRLLRQLEVSVSEIKRLSSGEIHLSAVLADYFTGHALSFSEENIKSVREEIRDSGVEYAALDAPAYLEKLDKTVQEQSRNRITLEDVVPRLKHPWRRFFARTIDYGVYSLIWYFILYGIIGAYPIRSNIVRFMCTFIPFAMMLFIEPLLLSKFGTTPGKWIFGFSIHDNSGHKPSYLTGLQRTWDVFLYGYGFNIPIYDIVREIISYNECQRGELKWDRGFVYTLRDTRAYRAFVCIAAYALIVSGSQYLTSNAEMPKSRGNISAAQFAENFNGYMGYIGTDNGRQLKADGSWQKKPNVIDILPESYPIFHITEENGTVTEVSFEADSPAFPPIIREDMKAAIISYVGAQPGMNCLKLQSLNIDSKLNSGSGFSDFDFTAAGIKVICTNKLLKTYPSNGGPAETNYHVTFSMQKLN